MRAVRALVPGGTVGLVRVLLLFESSMYAAVTPILPHYAHTLHIAKPAVGVLAAAYTVGLLPGSILGGWVATRWGVRRTTMIGLVAFAFGVAGFGFASSLVALDLLRAIQGVACGLIWGGALSWVIAVTPVARRGATLGSVIGAATLGTLIGPLLGTMAVATSTGLVFSAVGAVSLGLAAWVHPQPDPARLDASSRSPGPSSARRRRLHLPSARAPGALGLYLGGWMILLEAMTFGAANALLPLRLAHLGASAVVIGAAFLGAAALSTVLSPLIGRVTDRRGPRLPITAGLLLSAVLVPALTLPRSPALLGVLVVLALGGPMTGYMIPAVSTMTDAAERHGIALVVASSLFNLAYAAGETIGAPAAAVLSQASSDAVPLLALGALMLLTLIPARGLRKPPERSPGEPRIHESEPSGEGARALAAHG